MNSSNFNRNNMNMVGMNNNNNNNNNRRPTQNNTVNNVNLGMNNNRMLAPTEEDRLQASINSIADVVASMGLAPQFLGAEETNQ